MSRAFVSLVVVCAFAVVAQATITHTVTLAGTYTLGIGANPKKTIDVYTVRFAVVDPNVKLGALVLEVGVNAGDPSYAQGIPAPDPNWVFDDPFQAGWYYQAGKVIMTALTPTKADADTWLLPVDTSKCYETDSHFLPVGMGTWSPVVVLPVEVNDGSIYKVLNDYQAGVGNLRTAMAIPVANRVNAMDVIRVGVIQGDTVWVYSGSADELGNTTKERFIVPEPATLSLLVLGALALIGRRRSA